MGSTAIACLQGAVATASLLILTFAPGEHGRMLLIPVTGQPVAAETLRPLMLTPLASGPLPGSVIVDGRGRSLAGALFDKGIVMVAAPAAICGGIGSPGVTADG